MEGLVRLSFWSDENRWFVPRKLGLGYSLNLKYVAKRLGWVKAGRVEVPPAIDSTEHEDSKAETMTREQRLRERIESSKVEDIR
jgi:hypothetical protein